MSPKKKKKKLPFRIGCWYAFQYMDAAKRSGDPVEVAKEGLIERRVTARFCQTDKEGSLYFSFDWCVNADDINQDFDLIVNPDWIIRKSIKKLDIRWKNVRNL